MPDTGTLTGCCPNPFSLGLKRFLINLRLAPGDLKTRPSGSNSSNRLFAKNVLMTAQRNFCLGNSLLMLDKKVQTGFLQPVSSVKHPGSVCRQGTKFN
jgi:hypothetical protein